MIFEKVTEILSELSMKDSITEESTLQAELALDSLLMVTLLIELEERFEIELDESDMNPFDLVTVRDVIHLIEKYKGDEDNEENN